MAKKNNLRITEILKSKGMTLGDLAERIAAQSPDGKMLTKSTLCGRINGNPTLNNLYELANALDVKIAELFPKEDQVDAGHGDLFASGENRSPEVERAVAAHEMKKMLNGEMPLQAPLEHKDEPSNPMGMYAGMPSPSDLSIPQSQADAYIVKSPSDSDAISTTTFCPHCGKKVRVGVVLLPEE